MPSIGASKSGSRRASRRRIAYPTASDPANSPPDRPGPPPTRFDPDDAPTRLEAQPGPQTAFLASDADITIYGGAAFGGKTYGLLLDHARWSTLPEFKGVIFRRTGPNITQEGGLWDESQKIYPILGGRSQSGKLRWRFPMGATIGFKSCQYEADVLNFKGMQADVISFDQLEEFTERQFFYLISRARGSTGIDSYITGTANPQPGWLANFLAWWIDPDSGYPIPERDGEARYFVRVDDQIYWHSDPMRLKREFPELPRLRPRSVRFIQAMAEDNPIGLERNPGYLGALESMRRVDYERLRRGNWKIRDDDGAEWPAEYFEDIYCDPAEWPHAFDLSVVAIDASEGKGDPCAIVFLGLFQGRLYVDSRIERLPIPEMLRAAKDMGIAYNPDEWTFEGDQFQKLLVGDFERLIAGEGLLPWPVGYTLTGGVKKQTRIQRLGGWLQGRRLRFLRGSPGNEILIDMLRRFGLPGVPDDGPDALEMGIRRMNVIAGGRVTQPNDSRIANEYEVETEYL